MSSYDPSCQEEYDFWNEHNEEPEETCVVVIDEPEEVETNSDRGKQI